jgi:carbon monoxide dehydrogenase subunit G
MNIQRTFVLDAPLQRAWDFLKEPEEVGKCLPGCHTVEVIEAGKYKASIGAKVGPIKVGFDVQVDTKEERPPEYGAFSIRGSDKDGSSKISADCTLALKAIDGRRTEVTYTSKVQIIGKLGKFAGGVMQKFADGINDQFVASLVARVIELEGAVVDGAPVPAGFADRMKAVFRKLLEAIRRHL